MKVLDASALLALVNGEPGAAKVASYVEAGARVSSVNYAEVAGKLVDHGMPDGEVRMALGSLGLNVEPFTEAHALATGALRRDTRHPGLSVGDRACLALAAMTSSTAVTSDRHWRGLTEVDLEFIR